MMPMHNRHKSIYHQKPISATVNFSKWVLVRIVKQDVNENRAAKINEATLSLNGASYTL